MRRFLLAFLATASLATHAADRSYAVLSIAADRLLIATYNVTTGSRVDRNDRKFVELPDRSLDRTILAAVDREMQRNAPKAKVTMLAATDPRLFIAANTSMEEGNLTALLPLVRATVPGGAATHLILITKVRAETRAKLVNSTTGTGNLEGLGFYVDRVKELRNVETGAHSTGYIAPFAYLDFTLVDLGTGEIVRQHRETAISLITDPKTPPWESLSGEQKASWLQALIRESAVRAVPDLLKP